MKRLSASLLCFVLLFLCACAQSAAPVEPVRAFTCKVNLTQKDFTATAELSLDPTGSVRLDFTSPATLEGLTAVFRDGVCSTDLRGIREDIPEGASPAGSCLRLLAQGLRSYLFTDAPPLVPQEDGSFSATLPLDGHPTEAVFDGEGRITHFANADYNVEISFLHP